jgi:hypothetical protein
MELAVFAPIFCFIWLILNLLVLSLGFFRFDDDSDMVLIARAGDKKQTEEAMSIFTTLYHRTNRKILDGLDKQASSRCLSVDTSQINRSTVAGLIRSIRLNRYCWNSLFLMG